MTVHDRRAGIAVPLFSLRGSESQAVGEIPDLVPFAAWARSMEQRIVQILPVNETRNGEASPYAAMSAFAVDPLYLRLSDVPELAGVDTSSAAVAPAKVIPRRRIRASKQSLLEDAWSRLQCAGAADRAAAFEVWRASQESWLDDYATFRVLSELHGAPWSSWPPTLSRRDPEALADFRRSRADRIGFFAYVQFLLFEQWAATRAQMRALGVGLMGDLPFVLGFDSVDAWSDPRLFRDGWTVGAPPDDFSATGQNWHLPLYDWEHLRNQGFGWWRRRVEQAASLYDAFRIDHIVGVFRTYSIPVTPGAEPRFHPSEEAEQISQGEEFLAMARAAAGDAQIVAEDLGTIPPFVREAMRRHGVPGYTVMRWTRDASGYVTPERYPEESIATTGTHDTTTLATWWRDLPEEERVRFCADVGSDLDPAARTGELSAAVRRSILEVLYGGRASWVVLPVQDLFGWPERINLPMTVGDENWNYRLPFVLGRCGEAADDIRQESERIAELVRRCGRAVGVKGGGE